MSKLCGTSIEGGCLCRAIRYTITFPPDDQEPLKKVQTCQCTQCRKATGSLVTHMITVKPGYIKWQCDSTYREYTSSSGVFRGFCATCGTSISWRSAESQNEIDIFSGTVDESYLLQEDGIGKELCYPKDGQNWCENFIPGVTDSVPGGAKYMKSRYDGTTLD